MSIDYNRIINTFEAAPVKTFKVDQETQDSIGRYWHDVRDEFERVYRQRYDVEEAFARADAAVAGHGFSIAYGWNRGATPEQTVSLLFA